MLPAKYVANFGFISGDWDARRRKVYSRRGDSFTSSLLHHPFIIICLLYIHAPFSLRFLKSPYPEDGVQEKPVAHISCSGDQRDVTILQNLLS